MKPGTCKSCILVLIFLFASVADLEASPVEVIRSHVRDSAGQIIAIPPKYHIEASATSNTTYRQGERMPRYAQIVRRAGSMDRPDVLNALLLSRLAVPQRAQLQEVELRAGLCYPVILCAAVVTGETALVGSQSRFEPTLASEAFLELQRGRLEPTGLDILSVVEKTHTRRFGFAGVHAGIALPWRIVETGVLMQIPSDEPFFETHVSAIATAGRAFSRTGFFGGIRLIQSASGGLSAGIDLYSLNYRAIDTRWSDKGVKFSIGFAWMPR